MHDHSARVILDVVRRYDIDGIHIDDYFYPYREKDAEKKEIPFPDSASWTMYQKSGGKLTRDDWRRDNVNRFLERMYRDVHALKPWVKVGISPFGIYRPGFPAQIKGFDQYESLFADPKTWLAQGWLDYLAPQLYWRIEPPAQSFPVLLKWWMDNNPKQRQIVAGINTTAIGNISNYTSSDAGNKGWPASEIGNQIQIARKHDAGHIHWNVSALMKNKGGINETLSRVYQQPTLPPSLRTFALKPPPPQLSVRLKGHGTEVHCEPTKNSNARFWIVYKQSAGEPWQMEIRAAQSFTYNENSRVQTIAVRSVDRFGNVGAPAVFTLNTAARGK